MADEQDHGWDGGWEKMVEDGHELANEIMLGPVHRYDLPHSYVPNYRFSSRHELVSRDYSDETGTRTAEQPARRLRNPRTRGRSSKVRTERMSPPAQRKGTSAALSSPVRGSKAVQKAARSRRVAAELGITVEQLIRLRRSYTSATVGTAGLGRLERTKLVAARMGARVAVVERYEAAERGAAGPIAAAPCLEKGAKSAPPLRPVATKRSSTGRVVNRSRGQERPPAAVPPRPKAGASDLDRERVRPPRNLLCESCGIAINREGWCRCS